MMDNDDNRRMISPSLLYQAVLNLTLNVISLDSSYFSGLYRYLLILFSYWSIPWLRLLTLRSAEKLFLKAELVIFLCSDEGMLNATGTAVCNLSDFYSCSKRCSFPC